MAQKKLMILQNKNKLQNLNIYIQEYLSQKERETYKDLRSIIGDHRAEGRNAYLKRNNKLVTDGKNYRENEIKNAVKKCRYEVEDQVRSLSNTNMEKFRRQLRKHAECGRTLFQQAPNSSQCH